MTIDVAQGRRPNVDESLIEAAVRAAVGVAARVPGGPFPAGAAPRITEVSVYLTGDDEMRRLNREYRGVDQTTDVLSFAFDAERGLDIAFPAGFPALLGEVILSCPYAERQAYDLGHSLDTELAWLTIHGSLQLLGYAHDTDERAGRMESLERQALRELGITVN